MLSSALIGCFTTQLISVARTANRSLLSGVNDGEIGRLRPYICLSQYQMKIQILRDFARMFSIRGMNMIAAIETLVE